jgi:hypothetical protein
MVYKKIKKKNKKNKKKEYVFKNYPEFTPNLSPKDIFELGSFGGTYWRPIYSTITNKYYENVHLKYNKWWKNIHDYYLTNDWEDYDKNINKYKVKVGTTLEYWEDKNWITKLHPYGWVQWYCDFFNGERTSDDERQIKRWVRTAGPNSRFRKRLINMIHDNKTTFDDYSISPKIRQTLQHWGYVLTKQDV